MIPFGLLLFLVLVAAGVGLLVWSRSTRRATGLPAGKVVYSDTGAEQAVLEPLVSQRFGLVGKPDYLVGVKRLGRTVITPLEVKSRRQPATPNIGHLLQLGAYCLIVEDVYGERPPYGYLRYADATLEVPFTDSLRAEVLRSAEAIRAARTAANVKRSHNLPNRCRTCGYRDGCGSEVLAATPRQPGQP